MVGRQDEEFWEREPRAVNGDIRGWIDEIIAARALHVAVDQKSEHSEPVLVQRPSAHRFDWRNDHLEASAVVERPFDPVLAEAIILEIREKAADALRSLTGNNADDVVTRAVERLSQTLKVHPGEVAEGVLLMRANTLAAHNRAYADPLSERDRVVRAVLDDLATSVDSLVDCYPGIRAINANRLALNMQVESAEQVNAAIDQIAGIVESSTIVSQSVGDAIDQASVEVRDVSEKLARESNSFRIADYIKARGELVAARLLDATNLVSALVQKAGSELSGISGDTWREIRKSAPKAAARGISKGTENAFQGLIEKAPIVALGYLIAGPWAAIAILVPSLRSHAKKAQDIKDKAQSAVRDD